MDQNKNYINNYKKTYDNNYVSYYKAYKKKPFYVKYLAVVFVVLGFFLLALTINNKGQSALPYDSTNYDLDWNDFGIELHEDTREILQPIQTNYSSSYEENLVDNGVFNRFVNVAKDVEEFGTLNLWDIQFFESTTKFGKTVNKIISVLAFPVTFAWNIIELVVKVVSHILGFEFGNIEINGGGGGGGFSGGR